MNTFSVLLHLQLRIHCFFL